MLRPPTVPQTARHAETWSANDPCCWPVSPEGAEWLTSNRGFTPEEVAERCAQKVISISDTAPPAIQAQARAFRKQLVKVLEFYITRYR